MTETLKQTFLNSKMSMRTLSRKAGVPYSSVHGLIKNNKNPQIFTFEKLAGVLRLELTKSVDGDQLAS